MMTRPKRSQTRTQYIFIKPLRLTSARLLAEEASRQRHQ
jgi:hypothetical protein